MDCLLGLCYGRRFPRTDRLPEASYRQTVLWSNRSNILCPELCDLLFVYGSGPADLRFFFVCAVFLSFVFLLQLSALSSLRIGLGIFSQEGGTDSGACSIKKTPEVQILLRRRTCISFLKDNKKARSVDYSVWIELYFSMAGVAGVEPTSTVLETVVLPLNYTPECLISISGYGHGMQPKK